MAIGLLSTTKIALKLNMSCEDLFKELEKNNWITKDDDNKRILTEKGVEKGGQYQRSKDKSIKWIVWPEKIITDKVFKKEQNPLYIKLKIASEIATHFDISPQQVNLIFSELGWIEKHPVSGWKIKTLGLNKGGEERTFKDTGIPYVLWPSEILKDKILIGRVELLNDPTDKNSNNNKNDQNTNSIIVSKELDYIDDFRQLHPAVYRTMDGHYVRSKAEMIIDNWLYMNDIAHAYERKVPVNENLCSDFFILKNKVYIEYWGLEENPKYIVNKKRKIKIYEKYNMNLIELIDKDLTLLDDILAMKLLKFNIQAF